MSIFTQKKFSACIASFLCISIFSFTPLVIPTPKAEAKALMDATEFTQRQNNGELVVSTIKNTETAAATAATAGSAAALVTKESLDGIAWSIAKQMVSNMTQSMINWINSGFQGDPAFVTDLQGMLLDAVDTAAGEYIKSLGGIGEFICSPFKLDVQVALQINYQQGRSGMPSGPNACKLSDIKDNIENFLSGSMNDWGQWLQITSNPQNTPYGAYLEAEAKLNVKLQNAAGESYTLADWGDGFLSKKVCEGVNGQPAAQGTNCKITTPGKVIEEALTFQLSTGPQALITADEVNEVIGALINQLALQAMQGVNGLLGLGGNSNYTDYSYGGSATNTTSYIDAAGNQMFFDSASIRSQMETALDTERTYRTLASTTNSAAISKLDLITAGLEAIDTLLADPDARTRAINSGSTYNEALAANSRTTRNDMGTFTNYSQTVKTELENIAQFIDAISAVTHRAISGLHDVPFSTLKSEGTTIQNDLTRLIAETTQVKAQTTNNIATLRPIITAYDAASSTGTSTISIKQAQQDAALSFMKLMQSGILTPPFILDAKRIEWTGRLQ